MGSERRVEEPKPRGLPMFIGSLPFEDHHESLEYVLERTPQSPHWVQLPFHPAEGFLVQFSEGLPGLRTEPALRVYNQGDEFQRELLQFYEDYLAATEGTLDLDGSRFSVSVRAAPGLPLFLERVRGIQGVEFVKGQLSGPLSVLVGIQDSRGRLAYYDERVREAMVKLLSLKGKWQTRRLNDLGAKPMVFVDEPALGNLGSSAFISISPLGALEDLGEILGAIQEEGGWPGVHVCANADWGSLLALGRIKVLSFDAFSYFQRLSLFREQVIEFLLRGGVLAWGVVPTRPEELEGVSAEHLVRGFLDGAERLAQGELSPVEVLERTFITPACGLGSLDRRHAILAMDLTVEVSARLRERLG
ncbi:MAG: hypothetical protein ACUVS3_02835 [Thermodesulfobacteriota bacterium]